jgi:5-methylcytosine-specific restriction endonuclease McrA
MGRRVARTRNNGEWTESQYWSAIRSALRLKFRYWKTAQQSLVNARRKYKGKSKRQKYEYNCNECKDWFKRKDVEIDHIIPVGSLKCLEDLAGFVERLTPEKVSAYQILCKKCHLIKTHKK